MELMIFIFVLFIYTGLKIFKYFKLSKDHKKEHNSLRIPIKILKKEEAILDLGFKNVKIYFGNENFLNFYDPMILIINDLNALGRDCFIADEESVVKVYIDPLTAKYAASDISATQYSNFEIRMSEEQRYSMNKFKKKYYYKLHNPVTKKETELMGAVLTYLFFSQFKNWEAYPEIKREFEDELIYWKKHEREFSEIVIEFDNLYETLFTGVNRYHLLYSAIEKLKITSQEEDLIELEKQWS
ncbi:hypothetical protein H3N56_03325 [Cetobacterium sp. 2A]|uniref:hypothetical protein n=1 Tax=unclassified Cetobacterium TaxID=2630983 RepID=UPI00163C4C4C|nr:hypothetical protein [Cetobacterium sp. 2A]MBC2855526.1 hypothetical protein [Cetobacterium sp. 2A]